LTAKRRRRLPGRKRRAALRYTTGKSVGRIVAPRDNDLGSELLQMQRRALATDEHGNIGDMTMTSSALGALLTTGVITQEMHDAGMQYARLYAGVVGRVSPPAIVLDDDRAGRAPDDDAEREARRARDEALWRQAAETLKAVGSRAKTAVDNATVYNRRPRFLESDVVRPSDARDALALGAGLEALAQCFGMRKARRAA
jgi:hypothetical protein